MSRTFTPHDYQREALDWLYGHPRTALYKLGEKLYQPMPKSKQDA